MFSGLISEREHDFLRKPRWCGPWTVWQALLRKDQLGALWKKLSRGQRVDVGRASRGTVRIAPARGDGSWNRKVVVEVESKGDRDL